MSILKPFKLDLSQTDLEAILGRVKQFPWQAMPQVSGWEMGCNLDYMRELCDYWVRAYDWRAQEQRINQFEHRCTDVGEQTFHFILEKGSGPSPTPLLLLHGWPGSVVEFLNIIEPLAHPERFGGRVEDAFDVVAPSLPGFGFSSKPEMPMGPRKMAALCNQLMSENLGYKKYLAQGGDWGGAIASWLGFEQAKHCMAIHINILTMRHPAGPQNEAEQAWSDKFDQDQIMENGYRTQQATKPQSLAYAMVDSPVGVAAWIIEKFYSWSDLQDGHLDSVHNKDDLLTNIMVYLISGTFPTASWIYYGRREEGGRLLSQENKRVEVPTAVAVFPEEMLAWPPRSYVERLYNIKQWTDMDKGGHFGAMEQPTALVADIQAFARGLK